MRDCQHERLAVPIMILALMLAALPTTFAQEVTEPAATFEERFPPDQPAPKPVPQFPEAQKERKVLTSTRVVHAKRPRLQVVRAKRPRSRVVVAPRSFLEAGTEVSPGERKFLDYAFSPTHTLLEVVTNTGGRVGWHNSPLPGPFFPQSN